MCIIIGCSTVSTCQRSMLPPHAWDESRGTCTGMWEGSYETPAFDEVSEKWRPVAISMLANDEFVEISIEKAREFTGKEFEPVGVVVLSRALKDEPLRVRLNVNRCLEVSSMNGSCFDPRPIAPRPTPIVVRLRERPARLELTIYEDCI